MAVIETRTLSKDFGGGRGILDLDLRVEAGRVHGFLGPNGSGKTTTIRLLLGYLQPTGGSATVLGLDPWQEAVEIRRRVGFLPGELALPGFLTARQYLRDSARLRGAVDKRWMAMLVHRLGADLDTKIRDLSKGNRQKIALLDALQMRPELLILDEPTDGLDPLLRHRVHDILRQHVAGGGTVFLSSHVVHEIQTTCDDVSIVLEGRLRRQTSIPELLAAEATRIEATLPRLEGARSRLRAAGITRLARRGHRVRAWVEGPILPAMQAFIDLDAYDVHVRQNDLEDAFLRMYGEA